MIKQVTELSIRYFVIRTYILLAMKLQYKVEYTFNSAYLIGLS